MTLPAAALEAFRTIVGPAHLITRSPDIDPYLTDFRGLYRGRSPAVLLPVTTEEVARIVRLCAEHHIGVVPQGGNTSYCGGATPDESGTQLVVALRRMNRVRRIEPDEYAIIAEAGCTLAGVQAAAEQAGRLFPLSLGSEGTCQIGGNLATNAGGTAVLRYGMMRELTLGLEVVLANGEVFEGLKTLRKDNSGYDLKSLFVGSEGTLGIITAACLKLFPLPIERVTALAAVSDPAAALTLLAELRARRGDAVSAFELIPRAALELAVHHIDGVRDPLDRPYPWYALIELDAARADSGLEALLAETLAQNALDAALAASEAQRAAFWRLRESIPEAQRHAGASIKHDISVPVNAIPEFIRDTGEWIGANVPDGEFIAYGHLGDGNLHVNVQQRPGADRAAFLARTEDIHRAVYDRVAQYRGSFSAEHGVGRLKIAQLMRYKGAAELAALRAVKRALDPQGIFNPGKLFE